MFVNNKNEVLKVDTFNEGSGILRDYYLNGNVKNEGVIKSNDVVDSLYFYGLFRHFCYLFYRKPKQIQFFFR